MNLRASSRLAAVLAALCWAAAAAGSGLPLSLEEPGTGRGVEVRAGDPALHLVFFATWCPPCVDELERLADLEERWGEQGYRLVLIAVRTRQSGERLAKFVVKQRPPGQLLFDTDGRAERALSAKQVPTHVVLNSAGTEIARAGSLDGAIEDAVRRLLSGE
jgi:thiol-disulfide isomerase/thioredoxin